MSRNILILIGLTVAVGLISAAITFVRAGNMSPLNDIQSKGLASVQRGNLVFFGMLMPVLVAVIAFFLYKYMQAHSPATVNTTFLFLALGMGVVLSILAAVVFKMRGFTEFTLLHAVYIAAFGWVMPMLWTV